MTTSFDFLSLLSQGQDEFEAGFPAQRGRLQQRVVLTDDEEWLEFTYRESRRGVFGGQLAPVRPMLSQFIDVASGDEDGNADFITGSPLLALKFARRFGALG